MNKLVANVVDIQTSGSFSLVDLQCRDIPLTAVVMEGESGLSWLSIGDFVNVHFKETEVSIAKEPLGEISLRNRIRGKIKNIQRGTIMCRIDISCQDQIISSIITTRSVDKQDLEEGMTVIALVKANELLLMNEES